MWLLTKIVEINFSYNKNTVVGRLYSLLAITCFLDSFTHDLCDYWSASDIEQYIVISNR